MVLDYELVPSTSKVFICQTRDYVCSSGVEIGFPTKPPMFTVVDIVEQGRVPILLFTSTNEEPSDAV